MDLVLLIVAQLTFGVAYAVILEYVADKTKYWPFKHYIIALIVSTALFWVVAAPVIYMLVKVTA